MNDASNYTHAFPQLLKSEGSEPDFYKMWSLSAPLHQYFIIPAPDTRWKGEAVSNNVFTGS